jgi:hypothetical protein
MLTPLRSPLMPLRRPAAVAALLVLAAGVLAAQGTPTVGCTAPAARAFDFWAGDWNVTANGAPAGTNQITVEEDGCVLHEHWTGARGGTGQSFNFYDQREGVWHQVWVDNQGGSLNLAGRLADGRLVLEGTAPGADGRLQAQRLTFIRNDDGTVRQLWEASADQGKTWTAVFDGLYRRK